MKRRHWTILWLAAAAPMLAFHYTQGQTLLRRDAAAASWRAGVAAEAEGNFTTAAEHYQAAEDALVATQADPSTVLGTTIAVLRAKSHNAPLPERVAAWDKLLKASVAGPTVRPELLNDMRLTLAGLHYETAYLLARSGTPQRLWRDEAEVARQFFRHVADTDRDGARSTAAADNVERVHRLEHADPIELASRSLSPEQKNKLASLQPSDLISDSEGKNDSPIPSKKPGGGGRPNAQTVPPKKRPTGS